MYWFHHLTECESVYEPALISCPLFSPKNLVINVALYSSASYIYSRKCFRHADCLTVMMLRKSVVFLPIAL